MGCFKKSKLKLMIKRYLMEEKNLSISSLIFGLAQCEGLVDPNKTYGDYLKLKIVFMQK